MARIAEDTTNCPELRGRMYSELGQYLFPKRRATELPADESSGEIIVKLWFDEALLREMNAEWPFFRTLLSNMDMVLAKTDIAIASRYADLVTNTPLRESIFPRLRTEWKASIDALLAITGQTNLLEENALLARSIRNRFPYLDPLNHLQIELMERYRAGRDEERLKRGTSRHVVRQSFSGGPWVDALSGGLVGEICG
jgi:hypothetical protein